MIPSRVVKLSPGFAQVAGVLHHHEAIVDFPYSAAHECCTGTLSVGLTSFFSFEIASPEDRRPRIGSVIQFLRGSSGSGNSIY